MRRLLTFILLCTGYYFSSAQDSTLLNPVVRANKKDFLKTSFVPSGNSFASNSVTDIRFITTSDGTLAAINLGFVAKRNNSLSGNVEVASPIQNNGVTRPASLDGLASDGKITLGLQYKGWRNAPSTRQITKALSVYNKRHDTTGISSFMALPDNDAKEEVLDLIALGSPMFIGFTVTINNQGFEYATDSTLSKMDEDEKYTFNGSAYLGFFLGRSLNSLLRLSVSHQEVYKQNPKNEYLTPFNGGSVLVKRELVIGKPSNRKETLFRAEGVLKFTDSFGINPSVTYRANASDVVFDLPIYLAQKEEDGKLLGVNGGIYLNYVTSSDSPFSMGVFIGSNLNKLLKL